MTSASLRRVASKYLVEFLEIRRGLGPSVSSELPTRPSAHVLIQEIVAECGDGLVLLHEQSASDKGRPDWTVESADTRELRLVIDHKSFPGSGTFAPNSREIAQLSTYAELGIPVLVFDGVTMYHYVVGTTGGLSVAGSASLVSAGQRSRPRDVSPDGLLAIVGLIRAALSQEGPRAGTDSEAIALLATYARALRDSIAALMDVGHANRAQSKLEGAIVAELVALKGRLSRYHDETLGTSENCASFLAQVLAFDVYARAREGVLPAPDNRIPLDPSQPEGADLSSNAAEPLAFTSILADLQVSLDPDSPVGYWYRLTSNFVWRCVRPSFGATELDFHKEFVAFFNAFDPARRMELGVYQTPPTLANWLVRAVEAIRQQFFADDKYSRVKVVDPCVGTGTILEHYMLESVGEVTYDYVGVDILPSALALANSRLRRALSPGVRGSTIALHLGDTLRDAPESRSPVEDHLARLLHAMQADSGAPLQVIVGNPPSNSFVVAAGTRSRVEALLDRFRPAARGGRSNIQQALNDEAYRFLAWSLEQVVLSGAGIVALVLPNSVLSRPSFQVLRASLTTTFDHLWILEFDEDGRSGIPTTSLFPVRQGRCVIIGVRTSSHDATSAATVDYAGIAHLPLTAKIQFLNQREILETFQPLDPGTSTTNRLSPGGAVGADAWRSSWPMRASSGDIGLFEGKCSGVKLSPVGITVHPDRDQLDRRMREFSRAEQGERAEVIRRWSAGQSKPPRLDKFTHDVVDAMSRRAYEVAELAYRPFTSTYGVVSGSLVTALRRAPGAGMRERPEVVAAIRFFPSAIAVTPSPRDVGEVGARFASYCHAVPDNDLAARGNAVVYALYWQDARAARGGMTVARNLSASICAAWGLDEDEVDPDALTPVMHYVYAVLSSSAYREAFATEISELVDASTPTRVPLLANVRARRAISILGERISRCERAGESVPSSGAASRWHLDAPDAFVTSYVVRADDACVELRVGATTVASVKSIPASVLALKVSGYAVVDRWLHLHTSAYLSRSFTPEDLRALSDLIDRISWQESLLVRVDSILAPLLDGPGNLVPPPAQVES